MLSNTSGLVVVLGCFASERLTVVVRGRDRIFNYAEAKEEEEEEEKQGSLFLHGVKGAKMGQPPRVVPLFVPPPFLCEFASASKCSRALPCDTLSRLCLCK